MKRHLEAIILFSVILYSLSGCKPKSEPAADSFPSTVPAISETMETTESTAASTAPASPETDAVKESETSTATEKKPAGQSNTKLETYKHKQISIQYPVISYMNDPSKQRAVNDLIKSNALSVVSGYELDPDIDQLSVQCEVMSSDQKRLVVIYRGNCRYDATTKKIFYTNTIDLDNICSLGFNDYADPYTMATYLLSDDCVFYQTDAARARQLTEMKYENDLEFYTKLFTEADFPSSPVFPVSFSYEYLGVLYFSIPVSNELGDYALISYQADSLK